MTNTQSPTFNKPTIVVKVGGNELDESAFLVSLAETLRDLGRQGKRVVVVHGGGRKIEELQNALQIEVEKVKGLRVTSERGIEAVRMALIGLTGPHLVAALRQEGVHACALNASDGAAGFESSLLIGQKKNAEVDLGWVGEVTKVNTQLIEHLLRGGIVPVVSPLAICLVEGKVRWLNVNADDTAAAVAMALAAEELVMFTNVDGLSLAGKLQRTIQFSEIEALLNHADVSGGMLPKLNAARMALANGVGQVSFGSISAFRRSQQTCFVKEELT